jgi:hypothetical protein
MCAVEREEPRAENDDHRKEEHRPVGPLAGGQQPERHDAEEDPDG